MNEKVIITVSGFAGNVISLGVNVDNVNVWSKNPTFQKQLKDDPEVSDQNLK